MKHKNRFILIILLILNFRFLELEAHTPPTPDFSVVSLCYGDSSKFINQSIGGVSSMWVIQKFDIALNDTITLDTLYTTDLVYLFPSQGTYYITLQEDNGHVVAITKEIIVGNSTNANFSFQSCTNQFINMSTCATSFQWDFGDGITSSLAIPVHQYSDTGNYVVTLIASNGITTDTLTNLIYISVLGFASPVYQITVSNDTVYCKITGGIWSVNNLTWYFSDGATASVADTFHVFQDTGSYNVTIRVYNSCNMFLKDTLITIFNSTTSVKEYHSPKYNYLVYPNPANNLISVTGKNINSISIFDLQGKKEEDVISQRTPSGLKIDLTSLKTGIYILHINNNSETSYQKLIID